MNRTPLKWLLLVAMAALVAGCSSDPTSQPTADDSDAKDFVRGEITAGATAFEYTAEIDEGALRIVGGNLSYDDEAGILDVDFALVNETGLDLEGPVRLRFLQVRPEGVTIVNADTPDSATATGAEFAFAFADTDTVWVAGAMTAPRTVQFSVEPGVSIGFTSRILVGDEPEGGMIGGLVWNDADGNGALDEGEMGLADVEVMLYTGEKAASDAMMMTAATDADGYYGFDGLGSGVYTVGLVTNPMLTPTTDAQMQVILVEYDGTVGDFLDADFGVMVAQDDTLSCLAVGNAIHAKGAYDEEMPGLASEMLEVEDEDCDEYADEKHDGGESWGRLIGPVTDLDAETGAYAVMGTWVYAMDKHDRGDDEIEVGDRVIVNAEVMDTEDGPMVMFSRIRPFGGNYDRVRGMIQEVVTDEDGAITGLVVLNTYVSVPEGFDCSASGDDEDHDEHDGDHR